jgi:4-amino-4-deoxy-L-arabinose transferase-like glycosyltransferase
VLVVFTLVLYCWNLGGARSLTDHETYVGGIARQLAVEGDWLLPRIGDQAWVEKPPLIHWIVGALGAHLGFGEAVARAPSALAGLGVVLVVAALAARWLGAGLGLVTGLVQASTLYMMRYARLAEVDMVLAFLVAAALAVFARIQWIGSEPPRAPDTASGRWAFLFWLLVGATNWFKGPLFGAAMVLGPCLAWLLLGRNAGAWGRLVSPAGITLAVTMTAAWPALVVARMPEALDVLRLESVGRATGEMAVFTKPVWYYLATWPVQLLPWTLALVVGAGPSLARAWREPGSADRFLWCWALVPLGLLSLPRGKGHHYLIHALPAVAPVMALGLGRLGEWMMRRPALGPRPGVGLLAALLVALVTAAGTWHVHAAGRADVHVGDVLLFGSLATLGLIAIDRALAWRRASLALAVALATLAAVSVYANGWTGPRDDPGAADRDFLRAVPHHVPPRARLLALGELEIARYAFYLDRPFAGCWTADAIAGRIALGETFYVVARGRFAAVLRRFGTVEPVARSARTPAVPRPSGHEVTDALGDHFTLFRVDGSGRRPVARGGA